MDVAVVDRIAVAQHRAVSADDVAVGASADSDGAVACAVVLSPRVISPMPKLTLWSSVMLVVGLIKLLLLARSVLGRSRFVAQSQAAVGICSSSTRSAADR